MLLKFSLHDPVTCIRMNASLNSANYGDFILISNAVPGSDCCTIKQSNKLISAEAELEENQVKTRCRYWRQVEKTSEKRAAKSKRIKSFIWQLCSRKQCGKRKGLLLTFQVSRHQCSHSTCYFLQPKSHIAKLQLYLKQSQQILGLASLRAAIHNVSGTMKSSGKLWKYWCLPPASVILF